MAFDMQSILAAANQLFRQRATDESVSRAVSECLCRVTAKQLFNEEHRATNPVQAVEFQPASLCLLCEGAVRTPLCTLLSCTPGPVRCTWTDSRSMVLALMASPTSISDEVRLHRSTAQCRHRCLRTKPRSPQACRATTNCLSLSINIDNTVFARPHLIAHRTPNSGFKRARVQTRQQHARGPESYVQLEGG